MSGLPAIFSAVMAISAPATPPGFGTKTYGQRLIEIEFTDNGRAGFNRGCAARTGNASICSAIAIAMSCRPEPTATCTGRAERLSG